MGGGVAPGRENDASLGIHGASYRGDKLTMAQDGGRVHGDKRGKGGPLGREHLVGTKHVG